MLPFVVISTSLTDRQVEGVYTLATGVYFGIIFPKSPDHPVSLTGIRWFNERDTHILKSRVLIDDPAKAQGRLHVSWHEIKRTVSNSAVPRSWHHTLDHMS